ncbi:MAG TPA: isoleucine--tRNA ligase, partial [Marinobacter sp.]|nr:isoleucine--tRNA ligase [Marinobacter sp.]
IWTTTPWTIPANQAVSLNPELEYSLVQVDAGQGAERMILATEMVEGVMARWGIEHFQVLAHCKGADLEHLKLRHPVYDRQVPVILGDHVSLDAGTGAVHTAPDHGMEDFEVGKAYGIGTISLVQADGTYTSAAGEFAGVHVYKADGPVCEALQREGKLVHSEKFRHSYPHCWRTKTPLIYRATPQWFISMDKNNLRADALDAIKGVRWVPSWGQNRIEAMFEQSPDWCISRQRTWGVPITLFVHKETQDLHPDTGALIEKAAQAIEKDGIDAWYDLNPADLLGSDADQYEKVTDTLDVWFDSGVTHESVLRTRPELGQFPADMYLEGSDQHRGWFQSSLLTSVGAYDEAPFRTVLTHGFIVDGEGRKMSKSLGNVISPADVVEKYGADIIRLWAASADYGQDISVSAEILERTSEAYRRIRNTFRFLLGNIFDFEPGEAVPFDRMPELDQWAMTSLAGLVSRVGASYDDWKFHQVYRAIYDYCVTDLSAFYLDVIKDRLYADDADSDSRRSAQTVLAEMLTALVRLVAPILSFTAEEVWRFMPEPLREGVESVHLAGWPTLEVPQARAAELAEAYGVVLDVRDEVMKALEEARNAKAIGKSQEARVVVKAAEDVRSVLAERGTEELAAMFIVSAVEIEPSTDGLLSVDVLPAEGEKCPRCWNYRPLGASGLCARCDDVVTR